jgi:hypothetical protein
MAAEQVEHSRSHKPGWQLCCLAGNYLQLSFTVQDAPLIAKPWGYSQCGESVGTLLSSQSQLMHAEASCRKHTREYAGGHAMSSRATKGPCMCKGSISAIHQMALLAAAIWPCRPTLCPNPDFIPSLTRYTTYSITFSLHNKGHRH